MQSVLFVDLDDTLFQSMPKCPVDAELRPMAFLKDGSPISFASASQIAALKMFQSQMLTIPVTARNIDAFRRVDIQFSHGAVLNYGGLILAADGTPDPAWLERSRCSAAAVSGELDAAREIVQRASDADGLGLSVRVIRDLDVPFYVIAKSVHGDAESVREVSHRIPEALAGIGNARFRVHQNGNNLAILPNWLDKKHAVEYLRQQLVEQHGPIITFGMGDSLVDLNFMGSCQYMIVPRNSQIASQRLGGIA